MHELAVCQALLDQVADVALQHGAQRVTGIQVLCGPLSGVEPHLLAQAFSIARAPTIAAEANLEIEKQAVVIHCDHCDVDHEVAINRLCCPKCGRPSPHLVSGDALVLTEVEFERESASKPEPCNLNPGVQYV